jgi:hypothetical protein
MKTPVLTLERYPAPSTLQDTISEDEWVAMDVCRQILRDSLREMRCPIRHQPPVVRVTLSPDAIPEIFIASCCDRLVDTAAKFVEKTLH